eukprot:10519612-Alexandrium_andersonii.AAC.1
MLSTHVLPAEQLRAEGARFGLRAESPRAESLPRTAQRAHCLSVACRALRVARARALKSACSAGGAQARARAA